MSVFQLLKHLSVFALILSLTVGCASSPKEPQGPSPEQLASEAIVVAEFKISEAAALGADTSEANQLLADAKTAFETNDYEMAISLSNQAAAAATAAIAAAQAAVTTEESKAPVISSTIYEVVGGDSLWSIAGSSAGYGDPYQWPLLLKANKAKIKDADLIYPGQIFDIDGLVSSSEVDAAIRHAKSRGVWSLHEVEVSDSAYLAQ